MRQNTLYTLYLYQFTDSAIKETSFDSSQLQGACSWSVKIFFDVVRLSLSNSKHLFEVIKWVLLLWKKKLIKTRFTFPKEIGNFPQSILR